MFLFRLQMNLNSIRNDYVRLEEWPFNSDTKYMAVRVINKNRQVFIYFVNTYASISPPNMQLQLLELCMPKLTITDLPAHTHTHTHIHQSASTHLCIHGHT